MRTILLRVTALICPLLMTAISLSAQTPGLGTWNVLSSKWTLDKKWSVFAEAQTRSQQFFGNFSYYEAKAGVGYDFPKNGSILLAMGHYMTYQPDGNFKTPVATNEFRIWEQFVLSNNIDRLKLEHRYRVEQRFFSNGTYRNRFRYRLNAIIPFHHKVIEPGTVFASVFNEIFLSNEGPYFEQNRLFGGLGYQFNKHLTVLSGFINRFDNSNPASPNWKNFFQTTLFFTIDAFKSTREHNPGPVD